MEYINKYSKYFANIFLWILCSFLILNFLPKMLSLSTPFILGWLVASIANPLVKFLDKRLKLKRKWGSIIIIVVALLLIVLGFYFSISKLILEISTIISQIPEIIKEMHSYIEGVHNNIENIIKIVPKSIQFKVISFVDNILGSIINISKNVGEPTFEGAKNIAKSLPSFMITSFMTVLSSYFMLTERSEIKAFVKGLFPENFKKFVRKYSKSFDGIIDGYFKAQFKIMIIIAIVLLIGFLILGIRFAFTIAIIISFLDFLPFLGTGTVMIPWTAILLLNGDYKLAIGIFVLYVFTQVLRRIIEPKILGDSIGIHPMVAIVLLYFGYKLYGAFGLIFSVPFGMVIINLNKQGMFDDLKFIIKDVYNDLLKFADISELKNK